MAKAGSGFDRVVSGNRTLRRMVAASARALIVKKSI